MDNQLGVQLNLRKKSPISEQLLEEMHRLIDAGILSPGAQLPTVRSLAAQLRVNFNTVARVYRTLDQEGLIITRQGRGSYVLDDVLTLRPVSSQDRKEQIERLIADLLEKANRYQIAPDEIQSALSSYIEQNKRKTPPAPRTKRIARKKRIAAPVQSSSVRKVTVAPGSIKHYRQPKSKAR